MDPIKAHNGKPYLEGVAIQAGSHPIFQLLFHVDFPDEHKRDARRDLTEWQIPYPRTDRGSKVHAAITPDHTRCQTPSETPRRRGTRYPAGSRRRCKGSSTLVPAREAKWAGRLIAGLFAPRIGLISQLELDIDRLRSLCGVSVLCVSGAWTGQHALK